MNRGSALLALAVTLAAAWAGGCARPVGTTPTKQEEKEIAIVRGKSIYDTMCGPCHDADNLHLIKDPPKLDGLFSKQKLPSGEPTTDQAVRDVILNGRGIMPPFGQALTSQDVDSLMQYLHTR